jgi:hypothetical protein
MSSQVNLRSISGLWVEVMFSWNFLRLMQLLQSAISISWWLGLWVGVGRMNLKLK